MSRASTDSAKWSMFVGAAIALLGAALLLIPIGGRDTAVPLTGSFVLVAAMMEFGLGLKSDSAPVRLIELLMSCIAFGSALLILVHPDAYPLIFVATFCLAIRGVGAAVAAFHSTGAIRAWVLAQGLVDLLLASILIAGAPLMAVISVISGVAWPPGGSAILANFIALSLVATGLSLIGVSLTLRSSQHGAGEMLRGPANKDAALEP